MIVCERIYLTMVFYLKQMFLEACKEPYRQIDKVHQELLNFEEIVDGLKRSCTLFDIQPPDEKNLKQCRREIKLIKVKDFSKDCQN